MRAHEKAATREEDCETKELFGKYITIRIKGLFKTYRIQLLTNL